MINSRRDFLKITVISGAGIACLGTVKGFSFEPLSKNDYPISSKPEWLEGPIVSKGSNQEPFIFWTYPVI